MTTPVLDAYWMPFTPNRQFKNTPRLVQSAQGIAYRTPDGREVLDGTSDLWCVGAGHRHPRIVEAMKRQLDTLDFASSFQVGHPLAFELAEHLGALAPVGLDRVFLVNSGSEACDTALKIALAYWQACGEGQRTLFVGRERGFHGVGFGGLAVGGMVNNRRAFGGVLVRREIHDALMQGPPHMAELMHGYTCSGHPLACTAALAMLDTLAHEALPVRVRALAPHFEHAVHALADAPGVVSVRNIGLAAGIELEADPGASGRRGQRAQAAAFDHGLLTRAPGDTLVLAPPFICEASDIDRMVERLHAAIVSSAAGAKV